MTYYSGADLPVCLLSVAHVREALATQPNPGARILKESRRFSTAPPGNKKADREVRPTLQADDLCRVDAFQGVAGVHDEARPLH